MGRILAIDFGQKRIGLAISDETQTIAQGLAVLRSAECGMRNAVTELAAIVREREVELIILSYPFSQSGGKSTRGLEVEKFKAELERHIAVPVELVDERYTTNLARQYLGYAYHRVRSDKHPVDKVAATILLESYLEQKRAKPEPENDQ